MNTQNPPTKQLTKALLSELEKIDVVSYLASYFNDSKEDPYTNKISFRLIRDISDGMQQLICEYDKKKGGES